MRLQVFLSHNGVCSRRKAMDVIQSGRVRVNGVLEKEPSRSVDPLQDEVVVDGATIKPEVYTYILLHKPEGYVTTKADHYEEQTVLDLLPEEYRFVSPVGRLDKDTEGLLLLTNDGPIAYTLTHPKFDVDKVYKVFIHGLIPDTAVKQLERGIELEGQMTAPAKISALKVVGEQTQFLMTIHEGKKRQIRRMMEAIGYPVVRLIRLDQGPIRLGDLQKGHWRFLSDSEVSVLKKLT